MRFRTTYAKVLGFGLCCTVIAIIYTTRFDGKRAADSTHGLSGRGWQQERESAGNDANCRLPPPAFPSDDVTAEDQWRSVEKRKSFVFSAYHDPRFHDQTLVRVFGILLKHGPRKHRPKYFCQGWRQYDPQPFIVKAATHDIRIDRKERWRDVVFHCKFPPAVRIDSVAISPGPCQPIDYALPVHSHQETSHYTSDFTVCLNSPLRNMSSIFLLTQWMEMNSLLGVDRFVIYNHSASSILGMYLHYYAYLSKAEVIKWELPPSLQQFDNDWNFGRPVLTNDCLYRNMFRAKYIIYLDLDEVLIPRKPTVLSLSDLLWDAGCQEKPYSVPRNVIFRTDWHNDQRYQQVNFTSKSNAVDLQLSFILKTRRQSKFLPSGSKCKAIIRPETMRKLSTHNVELHDSVVKAERQPCTLPPDVAVLHHYRTLTSHHHATDMGVVDKTVSRFEGALVNRSATVHIGARKFAATFLY